MIISSQNEEEIRLIREWERGFPDRLRELKGMPKKIYYIGTLPQEGPAVAIVGARACTSYGSAKARELGAFLAKHGVAVISGMADGIDGYAHEGALCGGGKTFAVLGCGADICYPRTNRGLREAIIKSGGGILTEYPPGRKPLPQQFPARNRIISALSDIVIVVEARKKSGSLITADFALEQGKTVLAFPGRIGDRLSEGTNALIGQGAGIVSSYETVLWELSQCGRYSLSGLTPEKKKGRRRISCDGTAKAAVSEEKAETETGKEITEDHTPETVRGILLDLIGYDPIGTQELLPAAGNDLRALQSALLDLVLDGILKELSPGIYVRRV